MLPDEGMAEASGGGTVPDQFAGLDIPTLFEKPILATREAMAMMSESVRAYIEMEQRIMEQRIRGRNDEQ